MRRSNFYPTVINIGANTLYVLSFFILFLNFLSGIIGGLWILFSGGWRLIIYGMVISFVMPWLWTIAFLPQFIFLPFLTKAFEKGNQFWVAILGFFANIYGNILIIIWTYFMFTLVLDYSSDYQLLPLLLLGYSLALGPLQYMAQKEGPNSSGSIMGVFLSQISYIVLSIIILLGGEPSILIPLVFSIIFSIIIAIISVFSVKTKNMETIEEIEYLVNVCPKCNTKKEESALFCTKCGYKFN